MRKLGLAVVVVALLAFTQSFAWAQQWEYGVLQVTSGRGAWLSGGIATDVMDFEILFVRLHREFGLPIPATSDRSFTAVLNLLGSWRWELVGVSGSVWAFKRQLP